MKAAIERGVIITSIGAALGWTESDLERIAIVGNAPHAGDFHLPCPALWHFLFLFDVLEKSVRHVRALHYNSESNSPDEVFF